MRHHQPQQMLYHLNHQYDQYGSSNMFEQVNHSENATPMIGASNSGRKRAFDETYDGPSGPNMTDYSVPGQSFGQHHGLASMKKRSEKPIDTHIHASTLRRLFQGAQSGHLSHAKGLREMFPMSDELSCEDCDNTIMLDEYTSDPDSYSCFGCNKTVCWRCSLRSQETNSALECLQCANMRSAGSSRMY